MLVLADTLFRVHQNVHIVKILFSFRLPAALQGSAKLEKAEILQMTVDHLKMLHASGGKGNGFCLCFVLFFYFAQSFNTCSEF